MNARVLSTFVAMVCVLLGATFLGLRYHVRQEAQQARQDSRWKLTYKITFHADASSDDDQPGLQIALPFNTHHCDVIKEILTPGPDLREEGPVGLIPTRTRVLKVFPRRSGDFEVGADFTLRLSPRPMGSRLPSMESLSADARSRFLRDEEMIPSPTSASVRRVVEKAPDESATRAERLQWMFGYCSQVIQSTGADATDDAEIALETDNGTPLAKARAFVALSRAIKMPARIVTGFQIQQQRDLKPRYWVEVFQDQMWVPYDPVTGYARYLPMNYVPVRRGGESIWREYGVGVSDVRADYSVEPIGPPESLLQAEVKHPLQIVDLTRLPVKMHGVMKLLLLLPLAALITSVMRNVVGIATFGTFSPALLALSFIYANWETGLAILIVVLAVGLVGRSHLERLHLLMVPRLSIILTVVILCVVFGVSLLYYIALEPSEQAVLLPLVILTNLIERFYVSTEEDGVVYTIQRAVGTLVVAVLCYLALGWEDVGAFILVYPEAHFFTIAAFIALGRYAGYRLTELWRFRELVQ